MQLKFIIELHEILYTRFNVCKEGLESLCLYPWNIFAENKLKRVLIQRIAMVCAGFIYSSAVQKAGQITLCVSLFLFQLHFQNPTTIYHNI